MTRADSSDMPSLACRDVTVAFGDRSVLAGITFDLPAGTITVIVGPNGAGKTTLLRVLAGVIPPSRGQVLRGQALRSRPTRDRVAFVAQAASLYPFLTLRENCLAAGRMEGLRAEALAQRADAAIARTLCTGMERQLAARLSGGYQRRAAIAAALMGDAPVLLLDEPTTGLDSESAQAIVDILLGLRAAGTTVVVSTHDFAFADAVGDGAIFLKKGTLQASGSPHAMCRDLLGAKKHVVLVLADPPDAAQEGVLATLSAVRVGGGYSLFSDVDAKGSPSVLGPLCEAGVALRECRIREPGVAVLFETFCLGRDVP